MTDAVGGPEADLTDDEIDERVSCYIDGLLTAVAVAPDLVPPSEWLPLILGDVELADTAEARARIGELMDGYNDILAQVADGEYQPELRIDATGALIAREWANGFIEGMMLREKSWQRLGKSNDGPLLFPILALASSEEEQAELGAVGEVLEMLTSQTSEVLAHSVLGIDAFRRRRERAAAGSRKSKPGRNDPCPCGSGKKFKMCCGA